MYKGIIELNCVWLYQKRVLVVPGLLLWFSLKGTRLWIVFGEEDGVDVLQLDWGEGTNVV